MASFSQLDKQRPRTLYASALLWALSAASCHTSPATNASGGPTSSTESTDTSESAPLSLSLAWADSTFSPRPGSNPDPDLDLLVAVCGRGDSALHEVAQAIAESHADTQGEPNLDWVNFLLRQRGVPYVMPRLWSAVIEGGGPTVAQEAARAWAKSSSTMGELRCGGGIVEKKGVTTVLLIQVDVLADLEPLPTRLDSGQRLTLRALLKNPTTKTEVVLLPPSGAPYTVPSQVSGQTSESRFLLTGSGVWTLQMLAHEAGGPLPVLTALVTVDEERPLGPDTRPVPGELGTPSKADVKDAEAAVFEMVNRARNELGASRLERDEKLDALARAHSQTMLTLGRIAHDAGDGPPHVRIERSGLRPKAAGENVALAKTPIRLHRALWASPAHRENMLLQRWDTVGVGIATRDDGALFLTQLFIDAN